MLRSLVLKRVLVEHLILTLPRIQAVSVPAVILKLLEHRCLCILGPHSLVFDMDLVDLALLNQPVVLIVPYLALLARL